MLSVRGVIWIRWTIFNRVVCNEEEAYAYANSNMGRSARYYPHYQMWVSHLVNRLIKAGIITCEYETAELRMEDVPVENLLCIVSDECSEGLEVADGQRKRTLDAIMKALGFELLEFAELEDLDHILSRDQKAAFYRAFDEFRCDFYGEERVVCHCTHKGRKLHRFFLKRIFSWNWIIL